MNEKILIVDDDSALAQTVKIALEQASYQVLVAENGTRGLEIARKELPDLILLDIVMPDINGIEVLKRLKADKQTQDIKVAIFTNFGQEANIKETFQSGASEVLLKYNLGTEDIVKKVDSLIHEPI